MKIERVYRILRNWGISNEVDCMQGLTSVGDGYVVLDHGDPLLLPAVGHLLHHIVAARMGEGRAEDGEKACQSESLDYTLQIQG